MDGFSIHPYRYPRAPEKSGLVDEVLSITNAVTETGGPGKVWISEIGWPTHRAPGGSTESVQARYCARTLALLQSTGVVERVDWYDLKDDGLLRQYNEHNFGLLHHEQFNCAPKPGIVAMSVFAQRTAGTTCLGLEQNDDLYVVRYEQIDGTDLLLAWTTGAARSVGVTGSLLSATSIMGTSLPAKRTARLSEDIVYLAGRDLQIVGAR